MTPEQKTVLARFLDRAGDYLGDGYGRPREEYVFTGDSLEKIAADIHSCRSCFLGTARANAVPGEGVENPLVLVIGEGPGQDEDRTGRPFVGKAGQLLDKMLAAIGLDREENCFIANVVKCRPPGNRDPAPMEALSCRPFLNRQIACLRPRIIFCVGKVAANLLLENAEEATIGSLRGRFFEYPAGKYAAALGVPAPERPEFQPIPLLASYHPSALLRNEDLKRPAWEDLKLLRSKLEGLKGS